MYTMYCICVSVMASIVCYSKVSFPDVSLISLLFQYLKVNFKDYYYAVTLKINYHFLFK